MSFETYDSRGDTWRYELDEQHMQALVYELLTANPPQTLDELTCYRVDNDDYGDVGRTIERQVFEPTFGNDAARMVKIYHAYESASEFFLTIDQTNQKAVGALRIIRDKEVGSQTLKSVPSTATTKSTDDILEFHHIESMDNCWDIGTVAVLPEYRSSAAGAAIQLYRAAYVSAMQQGVEHLLSIIDIRAYRKMTDYLGIPFVPLGDSTPFPFEDSKESVAVYGHTPEFYPKMRRKSFSVRGMLARKALWPLVYGSNDNSIMFDTSYKK